MYLLRSGRSWKLWGLATLTAGRLYAARAEGFQIESVGARFGTSPSNGASHNFHQAEAFMNWNLPWGWDLGKDWRLQSRLDASAGWLGSSFEDGFIGTLGPSLLLARASFPLSFAVGISPTLLSRDDYVEKDFGQLLQFTAYVGFNYDFGRHLRAGYRFQHMSNGGLSDPNPGLNLHMFALSYLF
jgi:hypothetical protein